MKDQDMFLAAVRIWAATAWADGVLADNERRLLEGLIKDAEIDDAARTTALSYLAQPVSLEAADLAHLGPDARAGVYRAACRMTTIDRHLADAERAFLERLARHLEIAPDVAADMQRQFMRPTDGSRA